MLVLDAAVGLGNSGAAVVNGDGDVLGVVTFPSNYRERPDLNFGDPMPTL